MNITVVGLRRMPSRTQLRARFNVRFNSDPGTGLTVYSFRLMRSPNGNYWLAVPARKEKTGTWEKLVTLSPDLFQAVLEAAIETYRGRLGDADI
jgi:DNA-binding cell septation regulator SpoVG